MLENMNDLSLEELLQMYPSSKFAKQFVHLLSQKETPNYLAKKRIEYGITEEEMSECLGMSVYQYSVFERDVRNQNDILNVISLLNGKPTGYISLTDMTNKLYKMTIGNSEWIRYETFPAIVFHNYSFLQKTDSSQDPDSKIIKVEIMPISSENYHNFLNTPDTNGRLIYCDFIKFLDVI